jgi:hypothetical protein
MLLYLDNSVLNRPFDDQRQPRIWLETLSLSLVLTLIEAGEAGASGHRFTTWKTTEILSRYGGNGLKSASGGLQ